MNISDSDRHALNEMYVYIESAYRNFQFIMWSLRVGSVSDEVIKDHMDDVRYNLHLANRVNDRLNLSGKEGKS